MTRLETPSEVKAYDVPGKKQTTSFVRMLALNIGELITCDETTMMGVDKTLCFRVDIDISKPLRQGIDVMIQLKYVKLPDFCYGCGLLGHVLKDCEVVEAEEDDPNLQYSSWLRASPRKSRRRSAASELMEEKNLFTACHKSKAHPKVRTKLLFDNPTFEKTGGQKQTSLAVGASNMAIDHDVSMITNNETFKCKQDDIRLSKDGDHKVRDTAMHAILECPLVVQIWGGSGLDTTLWSTHCISKARENLDKDAFVDFLAVMWECWNAHNCFVFRRPDNNLSVLGKRAIAFVHSFRELQNVELPPQTMLHPTYWSPLMTGCTKLNFDAGIVACTTAGWGFVLRDHDGNILLAGIKHHHGYAGAPVEEVRACLYGLLCAQAYGIQNIIIESDCLSWSKCLGISRCTTTLSVFLLGISSPLF
ncbi:hypothetical protein Cgig2_005955 [Carnegiea gigantea]|uniref:CCHC-type domain-containing protein n=1 Tax=Carnegiea gigantea TaxID=171969 RepID=A0A9Q1QJ11_9CARY|nr:hypothetical protein Cgig2_005955 [Carnegiea gigantea]